MAYCKSNGIRCIIRFWCFFEITDASHHIHYLLLLCPPIAGDRLLDLEWGIFIHRNTRLFTGKEDHSPSMGHGNPGGYIRVKEQLFNLYRFRLQRRQKFPQILVNCPESRGETCMGRRSNRTTLLELKAVPLRFHYPKSYGCDPGIYT